MLLLVMKVKKSNALLHFILEISYTFMNLGKPLVLGHVPYENQRFTT